ncbi:glutaredoxin family protein [Rhodoluna sp.]|jgi:glutaredoxin|uniref:glutaredoxin family protein n=1 Tax=Rhodoluna sp. TaxID=1969481 RepID=UPI0025D368BB|nr:glutaredoxin family protein [Rhodoluna sp.]
MSNTIELLLLSKPGCHLCEDAREVVDEVVTGFMASHPAASITVTEKNILEDEALQVKYSEEIPVLLINGKVHNYWRIDDERLKRALYALVSKPSYLKNNRCVG